jgi:hypothetical protein
MILLLHVFSAIVGIVGVYIYGYAFLRRHTGPLLLSGAIANVAGLLGVTVSGVALFAQNPALFAHSGTLLSNLTVVGVLIAMECVFISSKRTSTKALLRILSMYSWSWIFLAAALPFAAPYLVGISLYAAVFAGVAYVSTKWLRSTNTFPASI